MLLDLHIYMPHQDPLGQENVNFSARSVKKWARKLPMIDLDRTSEEFLSFIKQSNRSVFPAKQRLAAIDSLLPLSKSLLDHLRKYLVSQSLPLSDKAFGSFTTQQEICSEIAIAYKIIIQDFISADSGLEHKKIAKCIHRVMEFSLVEYVSSLCMYERPPKNIWSDSCQLYRLAEQLELTSTKFCSEFTPNYKTTITRLFQHYCALGPVTSIQLRHGEMHKVNAFITSHCESIQLLSQNPDTQNAHLFWTDLRQGRRPRICEYADIPNSTEVRYIDYSAFVEEIVACANEAERPQSYYVTSQDKLRPDLAARFQHMFETPPKRRHERIKSDKILHAVIGWTQIQAILAIRPGKKVYQHAAEETGIIESLSLEPLRRAATHSNHQASRSVISASANIHDSNQWNPRSSAVIQQSYHIPNEAHETSLPVSTYEWRVSNFSEGGCCLQHCGELSCKTHVGDIIAIQDRTSETPNERWSIGVIRWIQGLTTLEHKIGVQLLSNSSSTVEISCDDGYHQCGILLKQHAEVAQYSLLCPPGITIQNMNAKLQSNSHNATVKLGNIIEKTATFIHIELLDIRLEH